jgi:ribosomal protein L37AE/L43A
MMLPATYALCPRCRKFDAARTKTGQWYCPNCGHVWVPPDDGEASGPNVSTDCIAKQTIDL